VDEEKITTGWGKTTVTKAILTLPFGKVLTIQLPSLSVFTIISSRKCAEGTEQIVDVIPDHLKG